MSQRHQIQENTKTLAAFVPIRLSTSSSYQAGVTIDKLAYDEARELLIVVQNGAVTGTPDSYTFDAKIEHSVNSNMSSAADVTDATITQVTTDSQKSEIYVKLDGLRRYFRLTVKFTAVSGSSPELPVSGIAILHNFRTVPQS